jgi:hypothetical protein
MDSYGSNVVTEAPRGLSGLQHGQGKSDRPSDQKLLSDLMNIA